MFVRIKRRRVVSPWRRRFEKIPAHVDLFTLDFVVVRSVRTDRGPRQRVVKHLGCISEADVQKREAVASFYRYRIERALRVLAESTDPGTCEKLLAQMHTLLPPQESAEPRINLEAVANEINETYRGLSG